MNRAQQLIPDSIVMAPGDWVRSMAAKAAQLTVLGRPAGVVFLEVREGLADNDRDTVPEVCLYGSVLYAAELLHRLAAARQMTLDELLLDLGGEG